MTIEFFTDFIYNKDKNNYHYDIRHKKYKEHQINPYEGKNHFVMFKTAVGEHKCKTYTFIDYKKSHGWGWRIKEGGIALCLTVFTGFIGLAFKGVRAHWAKAHR